jgi:hypothetical protein
MTGRFVALDGRRAFDPDGLTLERIAYTVTVMVGAEMVGSTVIVEAELE